VGGWEIGRGGDVAVSWRVGIGWNVIWEAGGRRRAALSEGERPSIEGGVETGKFKLGSHAAPSEGVHMGGHGSFVGGGQLKIK
jgi:hypothetical protein